MTTYGLTSTGFVPKTLEVIREEMNASLRAALGPLRLGDDTVLGQIVGIVAEREAVLWELAELVNASQDPDAATGPSLDGVCAYTGTERLAAAPSTVSGFLTGTAGTVIAQGSVASVGDTGTLWDLMEEVTLALATAWVNTTAYVLGDIVSNNTRIYVCITAGTSAGSGGPTTTSTDITDNTVHWRYMGDGLSYATGPFESQETGPLEALAGGLNTIETPVSGWSSVNNLLDADLGNNVESDGDLRERRADELAIAGEATIPAVKAALRDTDNVPGVVSVTVFYNNTDVTDGDGIPPHAVEALVRGGDDQDIIDTLWNTIGIGIATYGTETGSYTDEEGTVHTFNFSRPSEVPIYLILELTYDAAVLDTAAKRTAAATEIKTAIVETGDAQDTGKNAVAGWALALAYQTVGVIDNTGLPLIGTAPAPATSTTVAIGVRELATYDSSRITINWTSGTP
jgi:uncharacterized phage protein gp47/JayE